MDYIVKEVPGLFAIIKLKEFRRTKNVEFDVMIKSMVPKVDAVDRIIHRGPAVSPGSVGDIERPWYMHCHQSDNLLVVAGERNIELYSKEHGRIEKFVVTPDYITHNGEIVIEGAGNLIWPAYVFHRIISGENGSVSVNLATYFEGIDFKNNFDIYDLDIETGDYKVIREGYLDQNMNDF